MDATEGIIFFFVLFFFFALVLLCWGFEQLSCLEIHISPEEPFGLSADGRECKLAHLQKKKAYFTSSNCVFHSTWNSRQETKGLFKKQFQANYDLKSALKELWWKTTVLFLLVFLLPFFLLFFFNDNTRMKPTFIQGESILIQFRVFQLFLLSDLWAPERMLSVTSVRWCFPYLKFESLRFLGDFQGLEELGFS